MNFKVLSGIRKVWYKKLSLFLTIMMLLGFVIPAWASPNVWIEDLGYNSETGTVYGAVYTDTYSSVSDGVYVSVYCDPDAPTFSPLLSWNSVSGSVYRTDFDIPIPTAMSLGSITAVVYDSAMSSVISSPYSWAMTPNLNLSGLELSSGPLSPAFDPGTANYSGSVPYNVDSITVTPTAADANAPIKVNGENVASGNESSPISMDVGDNSVTVAVYSHDEAVNKTYTMTVNRGVPSNNADLENIDFSSGTLDPAFDSESTSYTASVPNSVGSITLTPVAADDTATITVNGEDTTSGTTSTISLNVGDNTIIIAVSAEDGTTKTYTLIVRRAAWSGGRNGGGGNSGNTAAATPVNTPTTPADTPTETGNTTTVLSMVNGGTAASLDGSMTVNVPSNSLSGDGKVSITELTGAAVPTVGSDLVTGSKVFEVTLEGTGIVKPITLILKYDKTRFAGVPEDKIGLYYYNVSRQAWLYIGGAVDSYSGIVTAEVNHFTKFAVMSNASLPSIKDIGGHWAGKDIRRLIGLLAVSGYPDGTYRPDNSITRAEFITILAKALGWTADSGGTGFRDKIPDWAGGYIGAAVKKEVIKGYEDNTFRPDQRISREEMAVLAVRAMGKGPSEKPLTFEDSSSIVPWASGYVAAAIDEGIIAGMPGNVFKPSGNATRADTATVVNRLLDLLKI